MSNDVVFDDIATGFPEVFGWAKCNHDAIKEMPVDAVVENMVAVTTKDHDAGAEGEVDEAFGGSLEVIVVFDQVVDDRRIILWWRWLVVIRIRKHAPQVIPPDLIADHQVPAPLPPREANTRIFYLSLAHP